MFSEGGHSVAGVTRRTTSWWRSHPGSGAEWSHLYGVGYEALRSEAHLLKNVAFEIHWTCSKPSLRASCCNKRLDGAKSLLLWFLNIQPSSAIISTTQYIHMQPMAVSVIFQTQIRMQRRANAAELYGRRYSRAYYATRSTNAAVLSLPCACVLSWGRGRRAAHPGAHEEQAGVVGAAQRDLVTRQKERMP